MNGIKTTTYTGWKRGLNRGEWLRHGAHRLLCRLHRTYDGPEERGTSSTGSTTQEELLKHETNRACDVTNEAASSF